jgi:hypothetical protein
MQCMYELLFMKFEWFFIIDTNFGEKFRGIM